MKNLTKQIPEKETNKTEIIVRSAFAIVNIKMLLNLFILTTDE